LFDHKQFKSLLSKIASYVFSYVTITESTCVLLDYQCCITLVS